MARKIIATLALGAAGGGLFAWIGLPLPWILGPAFAVMVLNAVRPGFAAWPRVLGDTGITVVAYVLGCTMTAGTLQTMAYDLPGMVLAGALWVAACTAIGLLFAKLTGLSVQDGVLGSMPGGLSQMVLLADDMKGADPGIVAIMQTSRLVVVLYTVPLLAAVFAGDPSALGGAPHVSGDAVGADGAAAAAGFGAMLTGLPAAGGYAGLLLVPLMAWLGKRLRVPAGEFLGPVAVVGALAAAGFPWPQLPDGLLAAAQLLIGIYIGMRVQPRILLTNRRFGPLALVSAALLVGLTVLAAWVLTAAAGGSIVTWFLALAPGGLGEVAVTALVLGADVAQVTAYQLFRLLFVLVAVPPFLRWAFGRKKQEQAASG